MQKFLKCLTSVILSVCLCFSITLPIVSADEVNDLDEKTVELLYMAEVVDKKDFTAEELAMPVSRIEFVQYAAKLIKATEHKFEEKYFVDIADGPMQSLLTGFVKNGYISVPEDRMFDGARTIIGNEAVKIAVCMLGYGDLAACDGGYPSGYNKIAQSLDISVIRNTEQMNRGSMFELLAHTLEAQLCIPNSFGSDGVSYSDGNGENLLGEYHGIYRKEGYLRSAGLISLDNSSVGDDKLVIGDSSYFIGEDKNLSQLEKLLGSYVQVYYSENEKEERTVCYIYEKNKSNTKKLTIDINDFIKMNENYVLSYYDNDKEKTCNLERSMELVYNGRAVKEDQLNLINSIKNTDNGYIMLIDIDGGAYEYAVIKHYKNFFVSHMDADEMILYNGLTNKSVNLKDYEMLRWYNVEGQPVTFGTVGLNSVLSVAKSLDNTLFDAIIEKNTISGTITKLSEKNGVKYAEIDGNLYKLSEELKSEKKLQINKGGTFYKNNFGQLVYADYTTVKGSYIYAFLIRAAIDTSGFEETLKIRYLDQDGVLGAANVSQKVKIDGDLYDSPRKALLAIPDSTESVLFPQIARIAFDDKGCIRKIDTKKDSGTYTTDNMLDVTTFSGTYVNYISGGKSIGMNAFVNTNTVIFCVPELNALLNDTYDDLEFGILRDGDLELYKHLTGATEGYRTAKDAMFEEAIVCYGKNAGKNYTDNYSLFVFKEIVGTLDFQGNARKAVSGYVNGIERTIIIDDTYSDVVESLGLSEGDAFFYGYNNLGEINNIVMAYDMSQGGIPYRQTGSMWKSETSWASRGAEFNCEFMYVGYKDDARVKGFIDLNKSCYDHVTAASVSGTFTIVDPNARDGQKISVGTIADIKDASSVGNENCDMILIMYESWNVKGGKVVYRQLKE